MQLTKIAIFAVLLACVSAAVAGLSAVNAPKIVGSPTSLMIDRFVVIVVFGVFGLMASYESKLRGSLFVSEDEWSITIRDVINYGILPGLVLGLFNYLFFFAYRYSPFVTPRIREMRSVYDAFIISLESGITEEVIYRLFILSCLLFSIRHLYAKLKNMWPGAVAILPRALSLVLSSLLFSMVHPVTSFTAAFFGGMVLGLIYLKGGIESAIAAHFSADFLFFSASYLFVKP
jgi:hypothetical protein